MDVFFTLSGFLITSLLVEDFTDRGRVRLARFWKRRALRLLPAMLAVVGTCVALAPLLPAATMDGVVPTMLYVTDWMRAGGGDAGALGHTWSLAVEEQFYLLWPLVLAGLLHSGGLQRALRLCLVGAATVGVARELVPFSNDRIYNGFDFRADGLLIGCALALALHAGVSWGWLTQRRTVTILGSACGVVFVGANWWSAPFAVRTLVATATASLIAALCAGTLPSLARFLAHPVMRWLGTRSYGIYLWHYPVTFMVSSPTTVVTLSLAAAAISYRFVEEPFLHLKDRLGDPVGDEVRAGQDLGGGAVAGVLRPLQLHVPSVR